MTETEWENNKNWKKKRDSSHTTLKLSTSNMWSLDLDPSEWRKLLPEHFCSQSTRGFVVVVTKQVLALFLLNPQSKISSHKEAIWVYIYTTAASFHLTTPVIAEVTPLELKAFWTLAELYSYTMIHPFIQGVTGEERQWNKQIREKAAQMHILWDMRHDITLTSSKSAMISLRSLRHSSPSLFMSHSV